MSRFTTADRYNWRFSTSARSGPGSRAGVIYIPSSFDEQSIQLPDDWPEWPDLSDVRLWIKAFIPRDIPDMTLPVPAGRHSGKTMIPGPTWINDCYLTDNRSWSASESAKARMLAASLVALDLTGATPVITEERHWADTTTEVDCEDGDVECSRHADTSDMSYSNLRVLPDGHVAIDVEASGNNPVLPWFAGHRLLGHVHDRPRGPRSVVRRRHRWLPGLRVLRERIHDLPATASTRATVPPISSAALSGAHTDEHGSGHSCPCRRPGP